MVERHKSPEHSVEKRQHIEVKNSHESLSSKEKAEAGEQQKDQAEQARESVEKLAIATSETTGNTESHADSEQEETVFVNKSYKSVMHRVESQLPAYQRTFSKVLRNPSVDKASVIVGGTVARPSGIIGGAGLAFFGLLIVGYAAKTSGFTVPNSLFVLLVIIGWTGGLFFDFIYSSFRRLVRARS